MNKTKIFHTNDKDKRASVRSDKKVIRAKKKKEFFTWVEDTHEGNI